MGCGYSRIASVAVVPPAEDDKAPTEDYSGAVCPLNEPNRIKHLQGLGILDTVSDRQAAGTCTQRRQRAIAASGTVANAPGVPAPGMRPHTMPPAPAHHAT